MSGYGDIHRRRVGRRVAAGLPPATAAMLAEASDAMTAVRAAGGGDGDDSEVPVDDGLGRGDASAAPISGSGAFSREDRTHEVVGGRRGAGVAAAAFPGHARTGTPGRMVSAAKYHRLWNSVQHELQKLEVDRQQLVRSNAALAATAQRRQRENVLLQENAIGALDDARHAREELATWEKRVAQADAAKRTLRDQLARLNALVAENGTRKRDTEQRISATELEARERKHEIRKRVAAAEKATATQSAALLAEIDAARRRYLVLRRVADNCEEAHAEIELMHKSIRLARVNKLHDEVEDAADVGKSQHAVLRATLAEARKALAEMQERLDQAKAHNLTLRTEAAVHRQRLRRACQDRYGITEGAAAEVVAKLERGVFDPGR